MKKLTVQTNLMLKKGLAYEQKGKLSEAKECFMQIYSQYPDYPDLTNYIAKICISLNEYEEAHIMLLRSLNKNPLDYTILVSCAYVQLKLGILSEAEKNILNAISIDDSKIEAYLSLAAILVAKEDLNSALKAATRALAIDPFSINALNNLGAIFTKLGDSKSATSCFETSLVINNKSNCTATYNLASILYLDGELEASIKLFESLLDSKQSIKQEFDSQAKYSLSFAYLSKGDLLKGWTYYTYGFDYANPIQNRRAPNRSFTKPKWNFSDLNGQTLLVWGEQGIGDEVFFYSVLHELIDIDGTIIVECEPRLIKTLSRSYPNFKFRRSEYKDDFILSEVNSDYDVHISAGDLMGHFRTSIDDFNRGGPYMKADEKKSIVFKNRLSSISTKPKIGICWRSGKLTALRNTHYTNLKDWHPIFKLKNEYDFINLQYGECEQELLEIEELYDIKIHRWEDLDLKNDIESVVALIASLDYVVSIGSAVAALAGAVDANVILMSKKSWTNFGTNKYPVFNNINVLFPQLSSSVSTVIPLVAQKLSLIN